MTTLADRLALALKLRGLDPDVHGSRQAFERLAGLSGGYATRLLTGERKRPTSEILRKISDALELDYEWIATERGDPPREDPAITSKIRQAIKNIALTDKSSIPSDTDHNRDAGLGQAGEGGVEDMAVMLQIRDLQRARYPRLEACVLFYAHQPDRWSAETIAAARVGHFEPACRTWTSEQWAQALDRLEAIMRHSRATGQQLPVAQPSKK